MPYASEYNKFKHLASEGQEAKPVIREAAKVEPVKEELKPVETKAEVKPVVKTAPVFVPGQAQKEEEPRKEPPVIKQVEPVKPATFMPGQGKQLLPEIEAVTDGSKPEKITPERARLDTGDIRDLKGQTSVLKGIPSVLVRSIQKLFPDMNQSDACAAFMYMFIKQYIPEERLSEVPDSVKENVLQYRGDEITSDTVLDYLKQRFDVMQDQFRDVKDENRELRRQLDAALLALSYLITDIDGNLGGSKMNFVSASVDETYQRLMKDTKKAVQDRKNRDGRSY